MSKCLINVGIAPLYDAPAEERTVVDEGLYGMAAEILEKGEAFSKIRMEYRYEGYVRNGDILEGEWPQGITKRRVVRRYIDVMLKPEVDCPILKSMPKGAVLAAVEPAPEEEVPKGWVKVQLADGRKGYTKEGFLGDFVQPIFAVPQGVTEEELRDNLVKAALQYEGTTYRWGGKSPEGIDCSGLCAMAHMLNGIFIYRDAAIRDGFPIKEIAKDAMKKGDLVLFKGHVAMYMGGERKLYIHSTAKAGSDGVDINSFLPGDPLYRQDLAEGILQVGSLFPMQG